jgi:two-component system heavy metal sensor histidine kinase CusS
VTGSLRLQLLTGVIGGMTLLLIVFSVTVYAVIRRALIGQFDASLVSIAQMLAASVEQEDNGLEVGLSEVEQMPEFNDVERATFYEIWRSDGRVLAKSPSLGRMDLTRFEGPSGRTSSAALTLSNGEPARVVSFVFSPRVEITSQTAEEFRPDDILTVAVARSIADVYRQLKHLRSLLEIASIGTIALSLLVARFIVGRGLRPLNALAAEIAAVSEDNLAARVGGPHMPVEIAPVRNRLNDLLTRLEASFHRERRFAADVAHELRTPLAGIRSTLEVALTRKRSTDEYQASLEDCLTITMSMQTMINNLLMLARIEADQVVLRREQIRLAELVDSCWRQYRATAARRHIEFENRLPAEMVIESDPECLSMALSNLLDNAVEYANERGRIWIVGRQTDETVEIAISNTGCQLASEQVSQVFDSFWRGDSSRSKTGTHCGLGLALVQRIAGALAGRATADVQAGIFTMKLALPVRATPCGKIV